MMSRYFALSLLEDAVRTRWKILPSEQVRELKLLFHPFMHPSLSANSQPQSQPQPPQREGIKNYIVTKVIEMSSTPLDPQTKPFVGKLNLTLITVLKQEWPHNWPTFISDLVGSSKTSELLCENNMKILCLLSEEVFEFGKEDMTSQKCKVMKER